MAVEQVAVEVASMAKLGAGIAIGFVSRQPEIAGKALIYFIIGAGLAEACAIYALFIALQLLG